MSKAFTKENDDADDDDKPEPSESIKITKNYVTPNGFADLQTELRHLLHEERPKIVEIVRWAAGNGDRSENGDYIYGKRRLREIDRRVRYLTKRIESAEIVDPKKQQGLTKVFFGAKVRYAQPDGTEKTIQIVGVDEANLEQNKVSWISPIAKALMKSEPGDTITLRTPGGTEKLTILDIEY